MRVEYRLFFYKMCIRHFIKYKNEYSKIINCINACFRTKSREILKAFCKDSVLAEYHQSVAMEDSHGCCAVLALMVR